MSDIVPAPASDAGAPTVELARASTLPARYYLDSDVFEHDD